MNWLLPWKWGLPNIGDGGVDTDSRARSTPPRPVPKAFRDRDPSESIKRRQQLVPDPRRYVRSPSPPTTPIEPKTITSRHFKTYDSPSSPTSSPVIHTRRQRGPPLPPTPLRAQQSGGAGPAHPSTSLEPSKPNTGVNAFEAALKSRIVKGLAEGVVLQEHQHIARAFMASCEEGMFKGGQLWDDVPLMAP
ncbi:hypothetical protein FRB90_006713 [Tulasnella sp. 427]|nr:hypothetical protein FRB90_006713 [Tulasnella sp. 427]